MAEIEMIFKAEFIDDSLGAMSAGDAEELELMGSGEAGKEMVFSL